MARQLYGSIVRRKSHAGVRLDCFEIQSARQVFEYKVVAGRQVRSGQSVRWLYIG